MDLLRLNLCEAVVSEVEVIIIAAVIIIVRVIITEDNLVIVEEEVAEEISAGIPVLEVEVCILSGLNNLHKIPLLMAIQYKINY